MPRDKYKEQFARAASEALRSVYPDANSGSDKSVFSYSHIYNLIERPKDPSMGRWAFPVFSYARHLKEKPAEIAAKVANSIPATAHADLIECSSLSGFINGRVRDNSIVARETITAILTLESQYGSDNVGEGKPFLIEYSSANIAKPFGVGHLRSTVIGNSLRKIFAKLGYKAIGINFLGDWGTQFGKMIVAYNLWGGKSSTNIEDIGALLKLYVRFHEEAKENPSLDDQAREAFKKLEDGDPQTRKLWEHFKTVSMAEFKRIYDVLGVEFDVITGESDLNDRMGPVIERLNKVGLTKLSDGALIVELDDPNLPPCLLKKSDGATLYATRDLAGLVERWKKYRFEESLYIVGSAQADHFKQVFKVIEMLEEAEQLPDDQRMSGRVKHIPFGWVKFGDKTMSTRQGNIIFLEEVLDKARELVAAKIREKNPDLAELDETARIVGVGAVIFSQLSVRRQKDVNFIWEDVLNFEGETGPYLQYTHARLCALLRIYDTEISTDIDFDQLDGQAEQRIIEALADYPDAIEDAARLYEPNMIATYLLHLSGAFNKFYQRKGDDGRIDKIISKDNPQRSAARMALVKAAKIVINDGLSLLGLQSPEQM